MISPHTPPGTRVVCIMDDDCSSFIRKGDTYTVRQIFESVDGNPKSSTYGTLGIGVILCEVKSGPRGTRGFGLRRFRLADLPRCLTELLEPVNLPREALV